jgi:HlyD family secretion protein
MASMTHVPIAPSPVGTETPAAAPPWRAVAPLLRWATVLAVIAAVSAVGWRFSKSHAQPLVRYQTSVIDRGPITAKVTASGALSAIVTVQVGAQVSGRIDHLYVDFNSPVRAGQLIATLEPSLYRAAAAQARANEAAARAGLDKAAANKTLADVTYGRQKILFGKSLIARADLDAAEAAALSARADVEAGQATVLQMQAGTQQAELNLSYTRIISPIAGIVISRTVDVGQTVAASFQAPTLFTIAQDLTKMQVDTNVAEGDVGKLHEGMEATFTVDAYQGRTFAGKIRQVRDNATTLQNVVTYDAVIDVDNSDLALRPTMTANASFVYATRAAAVRIPTAALRFKPDATTIAAMTSGGLAPAQPLGPEERLVWLLRGGAVTAHVVRLGIGDGLLSEMTEGEAHGGDVAITEVAIRDAARHGP